MISADAIPNRIQVSVLVPSCGASSRLLSRSPRRSPPRSGAVAVPAFGNSPTSSPGWERAGAAAGVGSRVTQPMPGNQASTQEWASRSRTTYSFCFSSKAPVVKPVATRAGTPPIRSSSASAPEYCWQNPIFESNRKPSSVSEAAVEVALDRLDVLVRRGGFGLQLARQLPGPRQLAVAQQRTGGIRLGAQLLDLGTFDAAPGREVDPVEPQVDLRLDPGTGGDEQREVRAQPVLVGRAGVAQLALLRPRRVDVRLVRVATAEPRRRVEHTTADRVAALAPHRRR